MRVIKKPVMKNLFQLKVRPLKTKSRPISSPFKLKPVLKPENEKTDFVLELAKKYGSTFVSVRYKICKTLEGCI